MEPKVCLALGGGAARGLAHLGVLKVFEDAKLPIDMIAGTSLGALMGGLYASNPDADYWIGRVDQYLRSFRSRKTRLEFIRRLEQPNNNRGFFADMANLVRKGYFWGVTATKPAFISEEEYQEFLNPLIPDINIEQTKIPFSSVATDIRNGKRVVYASGPLRTAVRASCASRSTPSTARAPFFKRIFAADPLVCPECGGVVRIIAFIEYVMKP